jgi:hypothetical protein
MSENEQKKILIQNLVQIIGSINNIDINKSICENLLINENKYEEKDINNLLKEVFNNQEIIQKQDALNKLSSLFHNEENKKSKSKHSKNNNNNIKGLVFPKNKISIPTISLPSHNINNKKDYKNEIIFDTKNIIKSQKKKPLAAEKIMINKLNNPSNHNKIFDKINNFKNEFFSFKIPPKYNSPTPLPINIKPLEYEIENKNYNINYNNDDKKKYREEFVIKDYNLNDLKQRKEYINDIRGKLQNFAQDRKERDNNFKNDINVFNNIHEMIEKIQSKNKK